MMQIAYLIDYQLKVSPQKATVFFSGRAKGKFTQYPFLVRFRPFFYVFASP